MAQQMVQEQIQETAPKARSYIGRIRLAIENIKLLLRDKLGQTSPAEWMRQKEIISENWLDFLIDGNGKLCDTKRFDVQHSVLNKYVEILYLSENPDEIKKAKDNIHKLIPSMDKEIKDQCRNNWSKVLMRDMPWYDVIAETPEKMPIPTASQEQDEPITSAVCQYQSEERILPHTSASCQYQPEEQILPHTKMTSNTTLTESLDSPRSASGSARSSRGPSRTGSASSSRVPSRTGSASSSRVPSRTGSAHQDCRTGELIRSRVSSPTIMNSPHGVRRQHSDLKKETKSKSYQPISPVKSYQPIVPVAEAVDTRGTKKTPESYRRPKPTNNDGISIPRYNPLANEYMKPERRETRYEPRGQIREDVRPIPGTVIYEGPRFPIRSGDNVTLPTYFFPRNITKQDYDKDVKQASAVAISYNEHRRDMLFIDETNHRQEFFVPIENVYENIEICYTKLLLEDETN